MNCVEEINPGEEDKYWREHFAFRPYYFAGIPYEQYAPAYRYGWKSFCGQLGGPFDEAAAEDLEYDWDRFRGSSQLSWRDAKYAARDAWERIRRRGCIPDSNGGFIQT